ncbi:MAG TPA: phosphotransferase family protein [Acidimicrobiales bacterium]|nr:phosphotransferase family protein [Acidimicrobiales bacterium]
MSDLTRDSKPLQEVLEKELGPHPSPPSKVQRLSAGATSAIWSFEYGEPPKEYILRIAAPGTNRVPITTEASAMEAAGAAGVPVPKIVSADDDTEPFGRPYMIMERVEGETLARHILRDDEFVIARSNFARQCGQVLGRLRAANPQRVPGLAHEDQLERWTEILRLTDAAVPTFEWALRYLHRERPPDNTPTLVHGDFRLGNLIVGQDGVKAVLDWELVHLGDPLEDLGWLCARPWRFRGPEPVGGMGRYVDLLESYEHESGVKVDPDELRWWEVFATLRWGIICLLQAARHLTGAERSVELATIGRRVAETELDLLDGVP